MPTTPLRRRPTRLVVVQLSGGNDYLNTVVPFNDPHYRDARPTLGIPADQVLPLDDHLGLHPSLAPIHQWYKQGKVAVLLGIGYPDHSRSHFKSMDVWHTARTDGPLGQGWLGTAASLLDPAGDNPVTAVNFGRGLPRALAHLKVAAASVGQLESYGLFTGLPGGHRRDALLDVARTVYSPEAFDDWPGHRVLAMGTAAQDGADRLRHASAGYRSDVAYPTEPPGTGPISDRLRGIATVLAADLDTRISYTSHGSFDTHGDEAVNHQRLWTQLSVSLEAFLTDLQAQERRADTVILVFSEFGRRVAENAGGGTDHGAGGVAFLIGDAVRGGLYGEYPRLAPGDRDDGDVAVTMDFRTVYTALLTGVLDVDPAPVIAHHDRFGSLDLVAV